MESDPFGAARLRMTHPVDPPQDDPVDTPQDDPVDAPQDDSALLL